MAAHHKLFSSVKGLINDFVLSTLLLCWLKIWFTCIIKKEKKKKKTILRVFYPFDLICSPILAVHFIQCGLLAIMS